jgi:glycosyltransferase involved in cell wall biosynthesis
LWRAVKIAYVVSRFPLSSETFILRELSALDGQIEIELLALFPATRPFAHPDARPWLARMRLPSATQAARASAWWLARRPLALLGCAARLAWDYRRHPKLLAKALATLPLAAAHARTVRRSGVQHVHAHFATYPAIAAWACRRLTGVGYSITAHAHDVFVDQSPLGTLIGEASFVVTISEFNRAFLARYTRGGAVPLHVVHCGIDPGAYAFRPRQVPPEGPVRVLCVASFEEYKGHRYLLEALAGDPQLARMRLELVGGGSLEDEMRALAGRLGLSERVSFLGMRSEAQVAALLDEADVFVLASVVAHNGQMEGLPVALIEAMAAGIPVVATRLSGIPELVEDGVTGLLARPGDAEDLARRLRELLSDPAAARMRSVAGRELVEREFTLARSIARLRELFGALAPPSPPGRAPAQAAPRCAGR